MASKLSNVTLNNGLEMPVTAVGVLGVSYFRQFNSISEATKKRDVYCCVYYLFIDFYLKI